MNNINAINDGLKAYNLAFEARDADLDMLVISDRKPMVALEKSK